MDETSNAASHAWAIRACEAEPRAVGRKVGKATVGEKPPIDIERAVGLWGDTVLRLAFCKTQNLPDAEDIAQTVFMRLCQNRPPLHSDEHLRAWLLLATLRCSIDAHRDPWKQHRIQTNEGPSTIDQIGIPRDDVPFCDSTAANRKSFVDKAVASLPEKQRIAVHLHYFESYSTKEIASITGEKTPTVRSHLFRARAALKTMMGGIDE